MIFTPAELAANLEQSPFSEACKDQKGGLYGS